MWCSHFTKIYTFPVGRSNASVFEISFPLLSAYIQRCIFKGIIFSEQYSYYWLIFIVYSTLNFNPENSFIMWSQFIYIIYLKHDSGYKNLVSEEDFKNALYIFDIGQNDLVGAFGYLSYQQVLEKIPSFIAEIRFAIWVRLHLPPCFICFCLQNSESQLTLIFHWFIFISNSEYISTRREEFLGTQYWTTGLLATKSCYNCQKC